MPVRAILTSALVMGSLYAKSATSHPSAADVDSVLARYRSARAIQAKVKKTVTQELMGTTNESEGRFYFSKGKLRLDITKPEKSVLVYDGKNIWLESRLDESHVQVSHMKAGALKRTDSLMAALFDRKDALKKFTLVNSSEKDGEKTYVFQPKDKKSTEVRALEVALKGKDIRRIQYKDQMENTVNFEFLDLSKDDVPLAKFEYKPPKGASISEM
jgi:outer membrane lipoprotein-sorting protein